MIEQIITTDVQEINFKTYHKFSEALQNAIINHNIRHHTNEKSYTTFYTDPLTTTIKKELKQLREADGKDPGTDYNIEHYSEKKKHFIDVNRRINKIKQEIISKLSEAARSSLYDTHPNPSIPELLDFLSNQYGTLTPTQKYQLRATLGETIEWPTNPTEIQPCIDKIQMRFTDFNKLAQPSADAATKESVILDGLIEAIQHLVDARPDLIHMIRDRPEIFDSKYLFTLINNNMRNADFSKQSVTKALTAKSMLNEQKGQKSTINNKYCHTHKWNSNHESEKCFLLAKWIQGLTSNALKNLQSAEIPNKSRKGKKHQAKVASKKEMLDDSEEDI